jgi:hypothetical protein
MFGRRAVRPYGPGSAPGTGHSAEGPSQERQEHIDEAEISTYRQTFVVGLLDEKGDQGLTIHELSDTATAATGSEWHHGMSSQTLSILDKVSHDKGLTNLDPNDVVRLHQSRGNQSVYVLEKHRQGRSIARRRRTSAVVLAETREELERVKAELEALRNVTGSSDQGLVDEATREIELQTQARRNAERQADEFREAFRIATLEAGRLNAELDEANRQNALLRLDAHLRKTLEPAEAELVRRTGLLLQRHADLRDDQAVRVLMLVLRTYHDIVTRNTTAPAPRENPPE